MPGFIQKAGILNGQDQILALLVYNNEIYGGTYDSGGSPGHLQKWDAASAWMQISGQVNGYGAIDEMIEYSSDNKIYAGSRKTGAAGLLQNDGASSWTVKAISTQTELNSVCEFNSRIYAGTAHNALLLEYDGASSLVQKAGQFDANTLTVSKLVVFNSKLYGVTGVGYGSQKGYLLEWNGTNAWIQKAVLPTAANLIDAIVFNGDIYASTFDAFSSVYPGGELIKYNSAGGGSWDQVAPQYASQTLAYALVEYRGELYCVTGPNGKLLKWDGDNAWLEMASQYGSETWLYSTVVHNQKIYIGSGINGLLLQWMPGQVIIVN